MKNYTITVNGNVYDVTVEELSLIHIWNWENRKKK